MRPDCDKEHIFTVCDLDDNPDDWGFTGFVFRHGISGSDSYDLGMYGEIGGGKKPSDKMCCVCGKLLPKEFDWADCHPVCVVIYDESVIFSEIDIVRS